MRRFDLTGLAEKLRDVPLSASSAFAVACAERQSPIMRAAFSADRDKTELVESSLRALWGSLLSTEESWADELLLLMPSCRDAIPTEQDEDWTILAGLAETAVGALYWALQCRVGGSRLDAARAAQQAYEGCGFYVCEHVWDEKEHRENQHAQKQRMVGDPVVQGELGRQAADLERLSDGSQSLVEAIRETRVAAVRDHRAFEEIVRAVSTSR